MVVKVIVSDGVGAQTHFPGHRPVGDLLDINEADGSVLKAVLGPSRWSILFKRRSPPLPVLPFLQLICHFLSSFLDFSLFPDSHDSYYCKRIWHRFRRWRCDLCHTLRSPPVVFRQAGDLSTDVRLHCHCIFLRK